MGMSTEITNIFTAPANWRKNIHTKAIQALSQSFPIQSNKYKLELQNIKVEPKEYDAVEIRNAIMQAKSLYEPIRGDLIIKDASGKEIQRVKNHLLAQIPYLTPHNTFIIDGIPRTVTNQLRLKPGIYVRKKHNEELEAHFNLFGTTTTLKMNLEPETGIFYFMAGTHKIPAYPILKAAEIDDATIAKYWNKELLDINKAAYGKRDPETIVKRFATSLFGSAPEAKDSKELLIKTLEQLKLDPEVTKHLLNKPFEKLDPEAILITSNKLLYYAQQKPKTLDERNHMAFKKIHTVDDFIKERILLDVRENQRKLQRKLDRTPDVHKVLPSNFFGTGIQRFITTAAVAGTPLQISPLEIFDHVLKVTSMGEGGIQTEHAIPEESRYMHMSQVGVIDLVRTPENHRGGVELRFTYNTARDPEGNIYVKLQTKSGQSVTVKTTDLFNKVIALPGYDSKKPRVDAVKNNQLLSVPPHEVDYIIPNATQMFSIATNMIPFLNSVDGNRALMGSKMVTQAMALKETEPPLVRAKWKDKSAEEVVGNLIVPKAPVSGVVQKIVNGVVYIEPAAVQKKAAEDFDFRESFFMEKTAAEGVVKVPVAGVIPLATKTFIAQKLIVKPGDRVEAGQPLAETNFTKEGTYAYGRNLRVAYLPYYGMNTNDSMVVSQSATQKLTSTHIYKEGLDVTDDMVLNKKLFVTYFGAKYKPEQLAKIGDDGVIKAGETVNYGDPLVLIARKTTLSPEDKLLGRIHKTLVKPYKDASIFWEKDISGKIIEVAKSGKIIRIAIYTEEPLKLGDKISSRYGHKGVVAAIVPDDQMLKDSEGKTIDLAISPVSVITRLNPAQILETAVAKVAEKTGKPIVVDSFSEQNNIEYVKKLLKQHKISETETVYDPVSQKKYEKVLVGPQYIMKLMKTTETNYAARGVQDVAYDSNQQPASGGPTGAKAMGRLEVNGLLAHNARNILHEIATLKSQRNDEWWRAYQLGLPTPPLKTPFAYDKFSAMLTGAGIRVNKQDKFVKLAPLTDDDIEKISRGEIKEPLFVRAKDFSPEQNGLFDPGITGGLSGKHWGHFTLKEPIINPIFEKPATILAKIGAGVDLKEIFFQSGGNAVRDVLKKLDLNKIRKEAIKKAQTTEGTERDNYIKAIKYIDALKKENLTPDKAYTLSKIPVPPPIFRPIVPTEKQVLVADANWLLRDAILANKTFEEIKNTSQTLLPEARKHLYKTVGAVFGVEEPQSGQAKAKNAVGFLVRIAGTESPKTGFFQSALIRRRMDLSGRGTIIPDKNLSFDEVGLPEDAAWTLYTPFLIRQLVQRGYKVIDAQNAIKERTPLARDILLNEIKQRPILVNRAPSLYRYNVLAAYPKIVPGKSIRVHDLFAPIQAGDFDGDAVSITVPVTEPAVQEAREMTLSKMLLSDQKKMSLNKSVPQQESILGIHLATTPNKNEKPVVFESKEDAIKAYNEDKIKLNTPIIIK